MIFWDLLLIFSLIALNGFFVAVEFAAVASRRARLDILPNSEGRAGQIVRAWLEDPPTRDRLIAATQLGITVVSLALGAVSENTFAELLAPYFNRLQLTPALHFIDGILPALPLFISLVLVTSLHVVLGEQVPKVATLRAPERTALLVAPAMQVFGRVFRGFVNLLDWATRQVLALVGLPASSGHSSVYSLDELRQLVSGPEIEGVMEQHEREMLSAIIDFGEMVVRQVAVPRTEIIAVEAGATMEEITEAAIQHTISKLPVYENDIDHIIGIVHVRDLLAASRDPERQAATARSLAREALFVPETISVTELLHQLRARRQHMAIVLDEFGGTAGLVTLEDLVEEIVGEVRDSFDAAPPTFQTLPDGSTLVDGMTLIEDVNQHFGLHLADPNYDTLAGYVLGKLSRIPQVGDTVEDRENGVKIRVDTMDRLRIARLAIAHLLD